MHFMSRYANSQWENTILRFRNTSGNILSLLLRLGFLVLHLMDCLTVNTRPNRPIVPHLSRPDIFNTFVPPIQLSRTKTKVLALIAVTVT